MSYSTGKKVGARLQVLRKEKGIKQEAVPRKLKVSRPEISKIENGSIPITVVILIAYCQLIDISLVNFFQEVGHLF